MYSMSSGCTAGRFHPADAPGLHSLASHFHAMSLFYCVLTARPRSIIVGICGGSSSAIEATGFASKQSLPLNKMAPGEERTGEHSCWLFKTQQSATRPFCSHLRYFLQQRQKHSQIIRFMRGKRAAL